MSWIPVIWSAASGMCLMLALMHFPAGQSGPRSRANLCFVLMVLSVISLGGAEMMALYAETPETYSAAVRWAHLIYGFWVAGGLGFVHFSFGTGTNGLLFVALGLRFLAVVLNFTTGESLHFVELTGIERVIFFGEEVAILGEWVANPWVRIGQLGALVQIAYVIDASLRLWRNGSREQRRHALLIGGNIVLFILVVTVKSALNSAGIVRAPLLVSFPFLMLVLVIGYDLSREVRRAARITTELEKSERRLALAASSARLALWEWHLESDRIWVSKSGKSLYGLPEEEEVRFESFLATVHEEDRATAEKEARVSLEGKAPLASEYRIVLPDGGVRWIAAMGRLERGLHGEGTLLRGVSIDVTSRKIAELENARQNRELSHLSRVGLLGELAGSLAHELNQPLTAILGNAQVGRRYLTDDSPDLQELGEILDDVIADTKRADSIMQGMRSMVKKDFLPGNESLDLNTVADEAMSLLKGEIAARRARVEWLPGLGLPPVKAGRVELQQVLINLILNGLDAIREVPKKGRDADPAVCIETKYENGEVIVIVRDDGPGIPAAMENRLFEPFATTKEGGLGLGLSISRAIVRRFGGELEYVPEDAPAGATFRLSLRV
jgi:two-component system, LuxR family, sensor kinase FixL